VLIEEKAAGHEAGGFFISGSGAFQSMPAAPEWVS
jgi:hypothetical protein